VYVIQKPDVRIANVFFIYPALKEMKHEKNEKKKENRRSLCDVKYFDLLLLISKKERKIDQ
jgi:hypothetical protein